MDFVLLNVFENLCSDVILGLDFQGRHQRVIFEFNEESNDLVISGKSTCAVTAASTDAVSLFSNLAPEAKLLSRNPADLTKKTESLFKERLTNG